MSHLRITHEIPATDALSKVSYTYINLHDLDWVLDYLVYYSRATKRHGWKAVKVWNRLNSRNTNMEREEPPQEVKDAVRRAINEGLRFS